MALIVTNNSHDKEKEYKKMKKRMENMESTRTSVQIPAHLFKKAKIKLIKEGKSFRSFVVEKLTQYLEE